MQFGTSHPIRQKFPMECLRLGSQYVALPLSRCAAKIQMDSIFPQRGNAARHDRGIVTHCEPSLSVFKQDGEKV